MAVNTPVGIAADSLCNLYIAEYYSHRVRKIDPDWTNMGTNME